MGAADERRSDVLRAIVADYVATGEPVGSKTLVERHQLDVSPATVRNDMSVLEEQGYLFQPHTSAGRIPTEKGYRAFVDQITSPRPLSNAQRQAIESFLYEAVDFNEVVERTVRVLAQLTRQLAVVQYPQINRSGLRHLELVPVSERKLLVVLITDTARVEQRLIEVSTPVDEATVAQLRLVLNTHLAGLNIQQLQVAAKRLPQLVNPAELDLIQQILNLVLDVLQGEKSERIVMAGAGNLVRSGTEFSRSIGAVLDALEEQVALLRLFAEVDQSGNNLRVAIGSETGEDSLGEAAVVTGTYCVGQDTSRAHVGVVGPTRMDYSTAMSAVRAVSRYLSRYSQINI